VKPKRLQRLLRNATLLTAVAGGIYLWNRYELIDLPRAGCSPLKSLSPGNKLWVDLFPARIVVGDVLFFLPPQGQLSLARVERIEGAPERYWLAGDDPTCPTVASDELGWIPGDWVQGRLMMAIDL
jgi:hypothetical protein